MPFDRNHRWFPAYLKWLGAYLLIALALGLGVSAWDRAVLTPDEPGFVYPEGQEPAPPPASE